MLGLFLYKTKKELLLNALKGFQNILDNSKRKPNEISVDKGIEFYNRSMKSCIQDNNVKVNSTRNEGKSVVAEEFIKTLKTKIYKYMT